MVLVLNRYEDLQASAIPDVSMNPRQEYDLNFVGNSPLKAIQTYGRPTGKNIIFGERQLNSIPDRAPNLLAEGCREVNDYKERLHLAGVYDAVPEYNLVPKYGNQRGDPHGLTYDWTQPTNSTILEPPNNYFTYLKNPLTDFD